MKHPISDKILAFEEELFDLNKNDMEKFKKVILALTHLYTTIQNISMEKTLGDLVESIEDDESISFFDDINDIDTSNSGLA